MYRNLNVSVVIPAVNEERAIGRVINALINLKNSEGEQIADQIIVCDNGSTDRTADVADALGAEVVHQPEPGYGVACLTAIDHLQKCDIVLFVDGDHSCKIPQAIPLLEGIAQGDDLAIGSRVLGRQEKGALTGPQRFGNWLSAKLIRLFWSYTLTDLGPFRAIRKTALDRLNMKDRSFGWTVEMQVKAIIKDIKMTEYPVDSLIRIGESKISGTMKGSIKAGIGILSMIFKLRVLSAIHCKRDANKRTTSTKVTNLRKTPY